MNIAYIVIFFSLCAVPLALWHFYENKDPIGKTELAEMPQLTDENGSINTQFFSEFDCYFTDHLTFRSQLVTADDLIKSGLLGGNTANIIAGKNGFIFSNETVDDYVGKTFSSRKIKNIALTVKLMEEKVKATGNNFVFTVAPNKNSVYPEYMPSRYVKASENNLSLLEKELADLEVNYADMKTMLSDIDEVLYLKRDTHWNNLGALYGFNLLMDSLGKEHTDYNGANYTYKKSWQGDLDKMLYPSAASYDYQYYFDMSYDDIMFMMPVLGKDNAATVKELMSDSEKNDTLIKTRNMKATGQLLMIRDSFGRALLPFLLNNYRSTTITRSQPFAMTSLTQDSDTDVIYEIVERNLGNITKSAPLMEAVECDKPKVSKTEKSKKNTIKTDKTDSFIRIYGLLDEKYFNDDSRIFVTFTSKDDTHTYSAFPICETDLLQLDEESDYGYSMILPRDFPSGSYDISVTVTNDSGNICTSVLSNIDI